MLVTHVEFVVATILEGMLKRQHRCCLDIFIIVVVQRRLTAIGIVPSTTRAAVFPSRTKRILSFTDKPTPSSLSTSFGSHKLQIRDCVLGFWKEYKIAVLRPFA